MSSKVEPKAIGTLGPREALLAILYSPDRRLPDGKWNWAAPIMGKTRLVKELFLLDKETDSGRQNLLKFVFTPGPYGPSSISLTNTLDELVQQGVIAAVSNPRGGEVMLKLVGKAGSEAVQLWKNLAQEVRRDIFQTKSRLREVTYRNLLEYVYKRYPEFTTNSLIREEVLSGT